MYLILSAFTGFMVALMIQLNGLLQDAAGGITALMSIHISGLIGIGFLYLVISLVPGGKVSSKWKLTQERNSKSRAPFYYLSAGMIGTGIVFLASVSFLKGGILLSLSGALAGQTLAASIAESLYTNEREKSPIPQRILAPALLIPGSMIIGLKGEVPILWILISWTPGILLMIQQSMNAGNTIRWGTPLTVTFNYVSALLLIVPLYLTMPAEGGLIPESLKILPWYVIAGGGLIGVFTTGSIAILLLKAPALIVILGVYAGELSGGLILDLYNGNPIAVEKLVGLLLIAAGLASGKVKFTKSGIKI